MLDHNKHFNSVTKNDLLDTIADLEIQLSRLRDQESDSDYYRDKLRESELKFSLIVQNIPDIVYVLDSTGKIEFISNVMTRYGYSPEELIGKNIMTLVHPDDLERARFRINERRTGDRSTKSLELRLVTRYDTSIPFEFRSRDVDDQPTFQIFAEGSYETSENTGRNFSGTVGIARDVTDMKLALSELRRLYTPADGENTMIPVCSSCKSIRDANDTWHKLEDYFHTIFDINFTHSICPECRDRLYPELKELE